MSTGAHTAANGLWPPGTDEPPSRDDGSHKAATPLGTTEEALRWCRRAPEGTRLEAAVVADLLEEATAQGNDRRPPERSAVTGLRGSVTWREKIWLDPAETRLGMDELSEALGRPKSFLYKLTANGEIPFRKQRGTNVFVAGEVRTWLRNEEDIEHSVPMHSTEGERALRSAFAVD